MILSENNHLNFVKTPTSQGITSILKLVESLNLFSVYPNPIKDNVKINTSLTIDSVEIHNQLGQRVMDIKGNTLIDNTIDVSSLNTGVYFLSISAEGKSQSIKIIKE